MKDLLLCLTFIVVDVSLSIVALQLVSGCRRRAPWLSKREAAQLAAWSDESQHVRGGDAA